MSPLARYRFLVFVISVLLCRTATTAIDIKPFESDKADLELAIDLSNEFDIHFGLIIRQAEAKPQEFKHVVLPFPTTKAMGNEQLTSTWGSYNDSTYISYVSPGMATGYFSIEMLPAIFRTKEAKDAERTSAPIILISDGQTRTLLYRYPRKDYSESDPHYADKNSDDIGLIGVLLPRDAKAFEVRPGFSSDPPELFYRDGVGFYPGKGQGPSGRLEISYWLPATEEQKALIDFLGKLFAAILTPLVTIVLTKTTTPAQIIRRRQIITIGILVQLLVLAGLVYYSYQWEGGPSISNLGEAILGAVAGVLAIAVWWIG
jgi:hypothetical protein